ncbi:hypothetical protein [Pseudomonas anguilliseptica]|uniref:hypothetical protein n=1 Tax=Pseudomonas anguilliseptica TaxID=53406 RepID=UPI003734E618
MDFDNPAYRLLTLLQEGKNIDASISCQEAWAHLLGVHVNSPELYARLGKVMELPAQAVSALRFSYPDESDTWSHWVSQVQRGFQKQALNQPWSGFIGHIDSHTINFLKVHSRLLQVKSKLKPLDSDVLGDARAGLSEVLDLLLNAEEMDREVRSALSRNIRKLINAIEEYKLTGSVGIFDAIEILCGHAHFDKKYGRELNSGEIGDKLSAIVGGLADSMTIALGLPQVSDSVKALIAYASS